MYDICILIPTYNEEQSIKKLSFSIKKYTKNLKHFVLFIDDSPNKKTCYEIKKYFNKKNTKIIHRIKKKNYSTRGEATWVGYNYILKNIKTKIIADIDADLAIPPKYIPLAVKILKKKKVDFVINSKYHKKSLVKGRSLFRRLLSKSFTITNKLIFGNSIQDYSAPRYYSFNALKSYVKNNSLNFYTPILLLDTLVYLVKNNFKHYHIATTYIESEGESAINFKTLFRSLIEYFKLLKKYNF